MDEFNFYDSYDKDIISIKEKYNRIKSELKSIKLDFGKYNSYDLWFMIDYPRTQSDSNFRDYLNWAVKNTSQLKLIVKNLSVESREYFLGSIKKYQYESFNI